MQLTTVQLWERIHASGLATPEQCRQWAKSAAASAGAEVLGDPGLLAKELVAAGKLTPYQANVLFRGLSHPIRVNDVVVVRSLESELGPNWYAAKRFHDGDTGEAKGPAAARQDELWVVAWTPAELAAGELQRWPPSLAWAKSFSQLPPHRRLLRWKEATASLNHLIAVAEPLEGRPLREALDGERMSLEASLNWVRGAAEGLCALHDAGLVHGNIGLSAGWLATDGGGCWLTDALFPPGSPYRGVLPGVLQDREHRIATAAPELAAPGAAPTPLSDLYAMGCVWYRLLTGQYPFDPGPNADADVWGRLHSQVPVLVPQEVPEPIGKCLLYLLAKNPAARFASAKAFVQALEHANATSNSLDAAAIAKTPAAIALDTDRAVDTAKPSIAKPKLEGAAPTVPSSPASPSGSPRKGAAEEKQATPAAPVQPVATPASTLASSAKLVDAAQPARAEPTASANTLKPTSAEPAKPTSRTASAAAAKPSGKPPNTVPAGPSHVATTNVSTTNGATTNRTPGSATRPSESKTAAEAQGEPVARPASKAAGDAKPSVSPVKSQPEPVLPSGPKKALEALPEVVASAAADAPARLPTINNPLLKSPEPLPGTESLAEELQRVQDSKTESATPSDLAPASHPSSGIESGSSVAATSQPSGTDVADASPLNRVPDLTTPAKPKKKKKSASAAGGKNGKLKSSKSRGKKKAKRPVWFMPMVVGCSLLLLLVLTTVFSGVNKGLMTIDSNPKKKAPVASDATPSKEAPGGEAAAPAADPRENVFVMKADDGTMPWAPPTVGQPHNIEMLPTGAEALLFVSGKAMSETGALRSITQWWGAIEPQTSDAIEWRNVDRSKLRAMAMAWYPKGETGAYERIVRIELQTPQEIGQVITDFAAYAPQQVQAESSAPTIWVRESSDANLALAGTGFRAGRDATVEVITLGPAALIETLARQDGQPGPLRRQMDLLLQSTDNRAEITAVAAPSFLYVDGKEMFGEHSSKVLELLRSVVGDDVQAAMIRMQFDSQWYVEWRSMGNNLQSAFRDAADLKKKVELAADAVESRLAARPADAYWRALANRYPQMLRTFGKYLRTGAEDGQVVANAYLPAEAFTNLALASWMAVRNDAGGTPVAGAIKPAAASAKTVDQLLDAKINLRIEQESLEVVLQAIATELKDTHTGGKETLPMAINGTAFQKDGITRNQQIRGFEAKDMSVRDALTALCRRANPVTTVKTPDEKDQKVVWLILDDPATPSKKKLDMTTRAWAESNQAVLPREFVGDGAK